MADKIIKTRIKLLYKSYSEWIAIKDSFVPLAGEVCIANVPASSGAVVQEPALLIKVGDGTSNWGQLSYSSALAADVYAWAKKANLDWADLDSTFKAQLQAFIEEHAPQQDTQYRIVEAETGNKWKLQKSTDEGATWVDAEGVIDVTAIEARVTAAEAAILTKVDKEVTGTNGKAEIFNEADGGGAHFIHNDGSESFVGVNDGGKDGMMAQIYADIKEDGSWKGSRINIYHNGIYYVSKANQIAGYERNAADMEIVVKKDIKDLAGALHFIGTTELAAGETYAQAIARLLAEKEHTAKAGDIVIITSSEASKEFIYDGENWIELGDVSMYATKAELQAEIGRATGAEGVLETSIGAEQTRAETAEQALSARVAVLESAKEPEIVVDGANTFFYANGVSIRIEDNTTENIAYYCTAEGVQKTMAFPYNSVVHAGGLGTATNVADFNSGLVIMNGGKVKDIYGGSRGYGNVGVATIVVNGGTLSEGVIGGGAAPNAGEKNSVGLANITLNGGTSLMDYGGGMGLSTVGKVNILVNGGTHQWVTAGGSNGTTGSADVKVTGGNITVLQTVNRGVIQDATVTVTGGTIARLYGGGETEDTGVTGKCEKTILHIEGSFNGHLYPGTYGGSVSATRISGDYVTGAVDATEAAACNLVLRAYPGLKQIAYTASTDDLVVGSDTWILDCNA